jgi:hypothetical protein
MKILSYNLQKFWPASTILWEKGHAYDIEATSTVIPVLNLLSTMPFRCMRKRRFVPCIINLSNRQR